MTPPSRSEPEARPGPTPDEGGGAKALAVHVARALADTKCEDVIVLDVRTISQMSDFIVLASGSSDRQMRAAAEAVGEAGQSLGQAPFRTESDERSTWIVVDFADVVAHVFEPTTRAYYDLEMLWGDAERVSWERARPARGRRADRGAADGDGG